MSELSIIMLAFNSRKFIRLAVESLLRQSYGDFELIIIDDGSTDETAEIIRSFSDPRIKPVFNEHNMGIAHCRNLGIDTAAGEYISFFDSDDIAHQEKYLKQIEFLKENSDYAVIGTSVVTLNEAGDETNRWQLKKSHDKLLSWMLFRNCFVTSSVVFRRDVLISSGFRFPKGLEIGEDYLLWWKLLQISKGCIMPDYLTYYRRHPQSIMSSNKGLARNFDKQVYSVIFRDIGIEADDDELRLHLLLKEDRVLHTSGELRALSKWLLKITSAVKGLSRYNRKAVALVILNRWLKASLKTGGNPWLTIRGVFRLCFCFKILIAKIVFGYGKSEDCGKR